MTDTTGRLSPIAEAVQIVQNVCVTGTSNAEAQIERLHELMQTWSHAHAVEEGKIPQDMTLAQALVGDPQDEDEPATATAYWAATSLFFRKVFQAAAVAA